jgi:hypothetical protein
MGTGTGTLTGPNVYTLSIANTALMAAVPVNPSRTGMTIQNNSANTITFTFGTTTPVSASVGQQITANANVTVPPTILGIQGNCGAQVNMIANVAGPSNVTVFEYY